MTDAIERVRNALTAALLGAMLCLATLWGLLIDSGDFINPDTPRVVSGNVVFARELPLGPVAIRFTDRLMRQGDAGWIVVCQQSSDDFYAGQIPIYDDVPVTETPLDRWFVQPRCDVRTPGLYRVTSSWTVYLWGLVPLRPISLPWTFEVSP